jgi:hypothetical protein
VGVRTFRIVPGSSSIETEIRSSIHPIHGRSTEPTGEIEADFDADGRPNLDSPYKAWLEVPVESIKSGNRLNDMEMQRRADVRSYPNIRCDLLKVWATDRPGRYRASIDVTAHGRSRPIEEEFTLSFEGSRLVVEGRHTFDMRDFGVNPPRILTLKVEPEVNVEAHLVAEEEGGT